ncbi:MAG: rhomboid family intramembrane serine protease [Weeksellaceae bacterium]
MKYPFPKNTLYVPLILLFLIWATFGLQYLGLGKFNCYGVVPRHWIGLRGVVFAPLFHSGWQHILNNSIPLAVLSFFAVLFYQRLAYYVIIFGWILSGILVWFFGNLFPAGSLGCHIGASGVVYLLASFIFFGGIFKNSRNLIAVSLIVVFLYGGMVWGVIPEDLMPWLYQNSSGPISWESHLSGALVGLFFALLTRNHNLEIEKNAVQRNDEPDAREKWLWEKYKETLSDEERTALEEKYNELPKKEDEDPTNWYSTHTGKK